MEVKMFEVRDRATFIPVMATRPTPGTPREESLIAAGGWGNGSNYVLMMRMDGMCVGNYDPFQWGDRTFCTAHKYILDNFDELESGEVIDVEFILGETAVKKEPQ